jgi:murein DD-endopeptidase MepM/ murein hydrolase activator NlpD
VGYGNYVVIDNADGYQTLYAHLASFTVHPGEVVMQGQVLGFEGATGWATGPHLHFEVRRDGQFLNPALYLPFAA